MSMQSSYDLAKPSDTTSEPHSPGRVLIVASDDFLRKSWSERLLSSHWKTREARSGTQALELLFEDVSELLLLDRNLPDLDPDEFESMVREQFPGIQIVELASASQTEREGFASPAVSLQTHNNVPRFAVRSREMCAPPTSSPGEVLTRFHELVGESGAMQKVYRAAQLVAKRDTTVLILGESGTGKDLLARAIHRASQREKQPFVVINCAAIPEALLEAELFGYTKGAFTGAAQSKLGRIHTAHGGTLFLDEIGDMPFALQSKLLRFLEQGEVQRIGGTDTIKVDCRVIAATNSHLKEAIQRNQFREDLYYRLAVFPIAMPALRERKTDLDLLTETFISRFCPGCSLTREARHALWEHDWPGNVRELRNVIERASLYADGRREIDLEDIVL